MKKPLAGRYIINDQGKILYEPDLIKWAMWLESYEHRSVKQDKLGEVSVSTVFLGLDYSFDPDAPPVLWETMVFGGKLDRQMDRCSGNREQAEAMHNAMVERVEAVEALEISANDNQLPT